MPTNIWIGSVARIRSNKSGRSKGEGTLTFTASFIVIILLFAVVLTLCFLAFTNYIDARTVETWSSLSDFITATLGIAVALAGSVVAIYIAHRAYSISRKQAFLEERAIVERTVDKTVETLWELSGSIRNLFDRTNDLVLTAFSNGAMRGGFDQDPKSDYDIGQFERALGEYQQSIENVRMATLKTIRDPIARAAFRRSSKRFNENLSSKISDTEPEVRTAWDDVLSADGDVDILASLLRDDRAMVGASPSLPARIVFTQFSLKVYRTKDGLLYTQKRSRRERDGSHKIVEVIKTLSDLEEERTLVGSHLRRTLSQPEVLLQLAGAYMKIEMLSRGQPERWLNLGAVALTTIIGSFPGKDDLLAAHDDLMVCNMGFEDDVLEYSRQYLMLSGIDNFLSSRISKGAEDITASPGTVIMLRSLVK